MRLSERIMTFIINNRAYLENEVQELQRRLRYRSAETGDGLQLELAIERLVTFNAMSSAIVELVKMTNAPEDVKYITFDVDYFKECINRDRERIKLTSDVPV